MIYFQAIGSKLSSKISPELFGVSLLVRAKEHVVERPCGGWLELDSALWSIIDGMKGQEKEKAILLVNLSEMKDHVDNLRW